jgi:hypothetical protein
LLAHSDRFPTVVAVSSLVREERFFETLPELCEAIADTPASIVFYSYTRASPAVIGKLGEMEIPCFSTPGRTARAVGAAADYAQFVAGVGNVAVLADEPRGLEAWPAPARGLSEMGARDYLAPLGIPSPASCLARSAEEAGAAFEALGGGAVALKVQSPDVAHKTDVGGVRLGLSSAADVAGTFAEMVSAVRSARPHATVEGVLVQRMAPAGVEVFVAAKREPLLGPLVVVGLGGIDVESVADVRMRLAPISLTEAHGMLAELRGAGVLHGSRGQPAADIQALALAVVRMAELAAALPAEVASVEINPLLVLPAGEGVLMLDAAIELDPEQEVPRT